MRVGSRFAPASSAVAGRWYFPASSSTLGRCRPGPRGFPVSVALPEEIDPRDLRFVFRALAASLEPATTRRTGPRAPPLMVFPALCLSAVCRLCVHSRRSTVKRCPSVRWFHPPTLVPSSWFLTTSTAFSTQGLRVCCTPLPALGFIAFPTPGSRCFRRSLGRLDAFPAMRARTLRRVLLASSRTASLRPLPSCRCHSPHSPRGVCWALCLVTMLRFA